MSKLQERIIEIYGDIKAISTDVKWLKQESIRKNGILGEHIKDSDKFRRQVARNTVWRHVYKIAIGSLYLALFWFVITMLQGCATGSKFYEAGTLVAEITMDSPGLASYEYEGKKYSYDARKPNWWQENIVPIFSNSLDKAARGR